MSEQVRPEKKPGKIVTDAEVLAMAAVQEILEDLEGKAAARVIAWAAARWDGGPPAAKGEGDADV